MGSTAPLLSPPLPRRTRWGIALLIFIAVTSVIGLVAWSLWHSDPAYWQTHQTRQQPISQADLTNTAVRLEALVNHQVTHLTGPGASPQRQVSLPLTQANAWLTTQLPRWLDSMGLALPEEVQRPMLAVQGDRLVLAFQLQSPWLNRVVSVFLRPWVDASGQAHVQLDSVHVGQLPIPLKVIDGQLPQTLGNMSLSQITAWIQGQAFDPVYPIDPTRQVRVIGVSLQPDQLLIDIEVQPRPR